jgi:hypothetical protein
VPSGLIEVPLGLEVAFPGGTVHHNFAGLPGPLLVRTLARASVADQQRRRDQDQEHVPALRERRPTGRVVLL